MISEKLNKSLSHQVPTEAGIKRIERLRALARAFGTVIEEGTKPGREQSLAITNLEQSLMWAVKSVVIE